MKGRSAAFGVLALMTLAGAASAEPMVVKDVGFARPESVLYDPGNDRYIMVNSNAPTVTTPNDGFLSLVQPDGTVANLKWIAGGQGGVELNDPRGAAIEGDYLYVTDVKVIRVFELATGKLAGTIDLSADAIALNNITAPGNGALYVTDAGNSRTPGTIFVVYTDGSYDLFFQSEDLGRPTGVAFDRLGNTVVAPGLGRKLFAQTRTATPIGATSLPEGRLDGLLILDDNTKLTASQEGNDIIRVKPNGTVDIVADKLGTPGAIGFDTKRKLMLIPELDDNALVIVPLPPA